MTPGTPEEPGENVREAREEAPRGIIAVLVLPGVLAMRVRMERCVMPAAKAMLSLRAQGADRRILLFCGRRDVQIDKRGYSRGDRLQMPKDQGKNQGQDT
jgi:hypothetical protein